jgi:HK97 family phage major capsid protein
LLGYTVEFSEDMPDVSAGSLSIAFGNFQLAYVIVDKAGIRFCAIRSRINRICCSTRIAVAAVRWPIRKP